MIHMSDGWLLRGLRETRREIIARPELRERVIAHPSGFFKDTKLCEKESPTTSKVAAALYIDPRGPYPKMPDVECWGLPDRDAKLYAGPYPVVAHPPCGPWGRLRHLCTKQDPTCGPAAVEAVRRWGGVLEHPAHSKLWDHCRLPRPGEPPDSFGGYTLEVEQVDWGHVARKRTWLYCVRVELPPMPPKGNSPTHWVSGGGKGRGKTPPGIKVCSAQQRRRTPPAFAEWLVAAARTSEPPLAVARTFCMSPVETGIEVRARARGPIVLRGGS